ncbi:hypothetical protein AGR7B_Cc150020 [Agrobacterium deltaense RV3]|nr:hypothetical protein AGR7B_Cc150020 [Agrobacterium deltaense RV3]
MMSIADISPPTWPAPASKTACTSRRRIWRAMRSSSWDCMESSSKHACEYLYSYLYNCRDGVSVKPELRILLFQSVLVISAATFAFTVKSISTALIPVLVTGIQSAQVLGLKGLFPPRRRASTGFL